MMYQLQQAGVSLPQWLNLAMNGLALLLFLAGLALAWRQTHREKQGADQEELARLERARNILQALLNGSAAALVTQAENTYGAGTGFIKKSAVLAELLKLLPEEYRAAFDIDTLDAIIESGLAEARAIWAMNN